MPTPLEFVAGALGPVFEEHAIVICPSCQRKVHMDPKRVSGKAHAMRCMRCGHKGAQIIRGMYPVQGDRSNVVPLRLRELRAQLLDQPVQLDSVEPAGLVVGVEG